MSDKQKHEELKLSAKTLCSRGQELIDKAAHGPWRVMDRDYCHDGYAVASSWLRKTGPGEWRGPHNCTLEIVVDERSPRARGTARYIAKGRDVLVELCSRTVPSLLSLIEELEAENAMLRGETKP